MIITVTATSAALNAFAWGSLALGASLSLLALLIQKEIIGSLTHSWTQRLLRHINLVLPPLYAVCMLAIAERIYDLLR